ncbi:CSS-motif domain-containing protein [Pseudomonas sp. NPDC089401]|uniref:CSS-motif domain-containing protein n=1 Tax=Pseudomonas sp. NPDC089401 TaxID=3364462 RepID=UPI003821005A
MSKFKVAGRCFQQLLLIVSISLIPVGFGLMMLLYQHDQKHQENARHAVTATLTAVDQILDRLHMAAQTALVLAGTPCLTAKPRLLEQIEGARYLRGLTLTMDGRPYCKTLATSHPSPVLPEGRHSSVQLVFGSHATPNAVHVAYQLQRDNLGVIATAYGLALRNAMRGHPGNPVVILETKEGFIWKNGDSRDQSRPTQSEFRHAGKSQQYGYTVTAGYLAGYSAQRARRTVVHTLPALALIGVITGLISYWSIFCHCGQRNRTAVNSA